MPVIDVNASKEKFLQRLKAGFFEVARSQNTESDYSAVKEMRDTEAVEAFLATDFAEEIKRMK